jgi:hypothetical protein
LWSKPFGVAFSAAQMTSAGRFRGQLLQRHGPRLVSPADQGGPEGGLSATDVDRVYWMIPAVLSSLVGGVINAWLFPLKV